MTRTGDPGCRLCGACPSSLRPRFTVSGYLVARCSGCGFVQLAGLEEDHDLGLIYDPSYFDKGKYINDSASAREQARRLRWVKRCGVPRGAKVLDAGCATGDFLAVAKTEFEVWGVDISEHAIARARQENPESGDRLIVAKLEEVCFAPGSFDALVLWDVVEHLWDPLRTLQKLVTFVRPGGCVVLSTANIGAPAARLMGKRWAFMTPPEHASFFDRHTLTRLLVAIGGEVEAWVSRGKWVNAGFLIYKLRQSVPEVLPERLARFCQRSLLGRRAIYVPSGDIQYIGARIVQRSPARES